MASTLKRKLSDVADAADDNFVEASEPDKYSSKKQSPHQADAPTSEAHVDKKSKLSEGVLEDKKSLKAAKRAATRHEPLASFSSGFLAWAGSQPFASMGKYSRSMADGPRNPDGSKPFWNADQPSSNAMNFSFSDCGTAIAETERVKADGIDPALQVQDATSTNATPHLQRHNATKTSEQTNEYTPPSISSLETPSTSGVNMSSFISNDENISFITDDSTQTAISEPCSSPCAHISQHRHVASKRRASSMVDDAVDNVEGSPKKRHKSEHSTDVSETQSLDSLGSYDHSDSNRQTSDHAKEETTAVPTDTALDTSETEEDQSSQQLQHINNETITTNSADQASIESDHPSNTSVSAPPAADDAFEQPETEPYSPHAQHKPLPEKNEDKSTPSREEPAQAFSPNLVLHEYTELVNSKVIEKFDMVAEVVQSVCLELPELLGGTCDTKVTFPDEPSKKLQTLYELILGSEKDPNWAVGANEIEAAGDTPAEQFFRALLGAFINREVFQAKQPWMTAEKALDAMELPLDDLLPESERWCGGVNLREFLRHQYFRQMDDPKHTERIESIAEELSLKFVRTIRDHLVAHVQKTHKGKAVKNKLKKSRTWMREVRAEFQKAIHAALELKAEMDFSLDEYETFYIEKDTPRDNEIMREFWRWEGYKDEETECPVTFSMFPGLRKLTKKGKKQETPELIAKVKVKYDV